MARQILELNTDNGGKILVTKCTSRSGYRLPVSCLEKEKVKTSFDSVNCNNIAKFVIISGYLSDYANFASTQPKR